VTDVASTTALVAKAGLTATALGYDNSTVPVTYAGTLTITAKGDGSTIGAFADAAVLNVTAGTTDVHVALTGDLRTSLTVKMTSGATTTNSTTAADTFGTLTTTTGGGNLDALKAVFLSGNGYVTIDNSLGTKLATINASSLGGVGSFGTLKAHITGGLTYTASASVTESIFLGSGHDSVDVSSSTYAKMDVISGFDALQESSTAGKSVVDTLVFGGATLDGSSANTGIEAFDIDTTVYTTLALAFVFAAGKSHTDHKVVQFEYGGNTYLFFDTNGNGLLDDADAAVKLLGHVDLTGKFAVH